MTRDIFERDPRGLRDLGVTDRKSNQRYLHGERGTEFRSWTRSTHCPSVKIDQVPDNSQAEAQTPVRSRRRSVCLLEPLEHMWKEVGSDPDPAVFNADARHVGGAFEAHLYPPASRRELDRVCNEI